MIQGRSGVALGNGFRRCGLRFRHGKPGVRLPAVQTAGHYLEATRNYEL
jgi:hypothetical protein